MKKIISSVMMLFLTLTVFVTCAYAAEDFTVSQVEEMLRGIDTLQQMQDKRSSYTASGHYDINTTNTSTISKHEKARNGYEGYVAEMFEKREEAEKAYNSLTDEEKEQIDAALVKKLDNELPTTFMTGEFEVTPRSDEFSFQAVKIGTGFGYEVSNHMVSAEIPQTFIIVDTADGKTSWSPDGEYSCGNNNYEVTYCCDIETPIAYGTYYKRVNLEDSYYFDKDEAEHIRGILTSSYPFVTVDEMKENLKKGGMDSDFVDTLTRADMIAAVQMAVWSYANIYDGAAGGLEYFASINIPPNTNIYFNPLHDYTNEVWDWLPGKKQRSFDSRAQYRVNTLADYLIGLESVEVPADQIVISDVEIVDTELISESDGIYYMTVHVTLNGGGNERDDLDITALTYSENENGERVVTAFNTQKAVYEKGEYVVTISARDGDRLSITVDGNQYLAKGVYFYEPENGRDSSQSLVGVSKGYTRVRAEEEVTFTAPDYGFEAPQVVTMKKGETKKIDIRVVPEIGAPDVTYTSSDESVATVDFLGYVTAKSAGTATITATLPDGKSVSVPIEISAAAEKSHYIVFGKTEKIGWYSVSTDGGKTFQTVFGNSNLVIDEGTELMVKAVDVFGDPFTFYINGEAVKPDENGYVHVKVKGYMLIGALGVPVEVPDAEESLTFFQKIIKAFKDFFSWIASLFD